MFTLAGILADEEPKTPISPNGLYDSSVLNSISGETFSQDLLSGRSEFAIMYWAYIDSASGTFFVNPYKETTPYGSSEITVATAGLNQINVSLKNSNGGTTSLVTSTVIDYQGWFHICVTGSVLNNRVRAYYNGVLEGSAVMTYSNATATGNSIPSNSSSVSFSQLNAYDRELTEAEVAEHYVNQNGQIGVLAYDAMTTAQRSGLIYCASLTDDISFAGNEFKDRSTSNISLSTTPPLTGQQIYVYTDVATSQIYALDAMNTTGAGSVYTADGSFNLTSLKASGMSFSMFIDTNTATNLGYLANFRGDSTSVVIQELALKAQNGNKLTIEGYNGSPFVKLETSTLVNDLGLAHIGFTMSAGGSSVKLYVDGSEVGSLNLSSLQTDTASALTISEGQQGNLYQPTDGLRAMPRVQNREITASEMAYLAQNPSTCYADLDNTNGLKDATIYAPTLGEYNGSSNQALVDPASGITTIKAGTVTYDATGVDIECS